MKSIPAVTLLLIAASILPFLSAQEPIHEKVAVNWWTMTMYAVHSDDRSVNDLQPTDIEVWVAGQRQPTFQLIPHQIQSTLVPTVDPEKTPHPADEDKHYIFLLFENIVTDAPFVHKSKSIATELVTKADPDQYFIVLGLEPNIGLRHYAGPSNDKKIIQKAISSVKMVKRRPRRFGKNLNFDPNDISVGMYHESVDNEALRQIEANEYDRSTFDSVNTLGHFQYVLKTLKRKTVFYFSTGIILEKEIEKQRYYLELLRSLGESINRSGAVLMAVNPAGTQYTEDDPNSGEMTQRYLATASGGQYFEGKKEIMVERLMQMNRSRYEIAFPAPSTNDTAQVEIRVKRPGVRVFAARLAARGSDYSEMNDMEKELLALDAVTNGYWAREKLTLRHGKWTGAAAAHGARLYSTALPPAFIRQEVDIYTIDFDPTGKQTRVQRETRIPNAAVLEFKVKGDTELPRFAVLIAGRNRAAWVVQLQ